MTKAPKSVQSAPTPSPIWMLFASGNSVEIHVNSYPASLAGGRPINGYMVADCDGDCEEAALRAAEIGWQTAVKQGKKLHPQVLGFDLKGRRKKSPVVGASGGLAMAIAAWQKISDAQLGPVAATGILQSTDLAAPILRVEAIVAKLEAAVKLVPENGLVLYPAPNDHEIPNELKKKFQECSIRLHGVDSISDAFLYLQPGSLEKTMKKAVSRKWFYVATCVLLLVVFLSARFYWLAENVAPTGDKAELTEKIEQEREKNDVVPANSSLTSAVKTQPAKPSKGFD